MVHVKNLVAAAGMCCQPFRASGRQRSWNTGNLRSGASRRAPSLFAFATLACACLLAKPTVAIAQTPPEGSDVSAPGEGTDITTVLLAGCPGRAADCRDPRALRSGRVSGRHAVRQHNCNPSRQPHS